MPRRQLTEHVRWDDSYFLVAYTIDALDLAVEEGDKDLAPVAKALRPLLDRYDALDVDRRQRERALSKCNVRVRRRDLEGDALATDIHNTALAEAKLDREDPTYQRLFPSVLSRVVKMALESELVPLRALREAMDHAAVTKPVKSMAPKLAAFIKTAEHALDARRKAFVDRSDLTLAVQSWRDDVNNALFGVEGELTRVAAKRKLGSAWVDSFFPPALDAKKKRKEPDPAPVPNG
jgi:hypothetical protein